MQCWRFGAAAFSG